MSAQALIDVGEVAHYINAFQARRRLGCGVERLQRIAMGGEIRFLALPGMPTRYHRADVERLTVARGSLQPADQGEGR
jgi:hypothetical protein